MEKLVERFKNYEIIKYFILVMLGKVERNSMIEEEYGEIADDYSNFIVKGIWAFKENFFRSLHLNPIFEDLKKYRDQAYYYMMRTYPYSFELNGCTYIDNLDEALAFYSMSRGASVDIAKGASNLLKEVKMPVIGEEERNNLDNTEVVTAYTDIESIASSTIPYYQGENLYDTLVKLDDKHIARYIEYIVMHNDAFEGICCYQNESGIYYVSEGNHRIMAKKAMNIIDEVTGTVPFVTYPVKITVNRKKDLYNGFGF